MPAKAEKSKKRKGLGEPVICKRGDRSPSPLLKKRAKVNSDQTAISLDDLSLLAVKQQLTTFSLVQLAPVSRRFAKKLKDQGKGVEMELEIQDEGDYEVRMCIWEKNAQEMHYLLSSITPTELKAFFMAAFQFLNRLRSLSIFPGTLAAGYYSVIETLKLHPVKIRILDLVEKSRLRDKAKYELLGQCGAHVLALYDRPRADGNFSAAQMQSYAKCTDLRWFQIGGSLAPASSDCFRLLKQLHRLYLLAAPMPLLDGSDFPLADVLKENQKLHHLTISVEWLTIAAARRNFSLIHRLKSIGLKGGVERDLKHINTVVLPSMRAPLLNLMAMMATDSCLKVTFLPDEQLNLFLDEDAGSAEAVVKNFIGFWLQLSSDGGGKVVVVKLRSDGDQFKQLIDHLLLSVDDCPLKLKESFPADWKIERNAQDREGYLIMQGNGRVVLLD